jgi:two-component system, OmpR family, sensor histidine kinase ChvG
MSRVLRLVRQLPRALSRIGIRLLLFNALLVFLPVAGLASLDAYEAHLLAEQERSMIQQARLLSAILSGPTTLDEAAAQRILDHLATTGEARLRVVLPDGRVAADSHRAPADFASRSPAASDEYKTPSTRHSLIYQLGAPLARTAWRAWRTVEPKTPPPGIGLEPGVFRGPALDRALAGGYGSDTMLSYAGQRSVTLYSALPIRSETAQVMGVALVSQTTYRLLQRLYDVRIRMFEVVVVSLMAALLLGLLASTTIVRPLRRLRDDAAAIAGRRVGLAGRFRGTKRLDEIGDLARALDELTVRLRAHLQFTERFAADVTHEFRNPLASIRASAEMLGEADTPDTRAAFLTRIEHDIRRLEGLLTRVREVTEIDAHLEDEPVETVDLVALCRELADGHNRLAEKGIRVDGGRTAPLHVRASRDRLVQVIENLIDNAASFSPPDGRITLSVAATAEGACLSVGDEGPGIAPEHLERVFDRFFSHRPGDPQARQRHAGLGLSIARAIVETYGGQIRASNRPGGGARFDICLPCAPAPGAY